MSAPDSRALTALSCSSLCGARHEHNTTTASRSKRKHIIICVLCFTPPANHGGSAATVPAPSHRADDTTAPGDAFTYISTDLYRAAVFVSLRGESRTCAPIARDSCLSATCACPRTCTPAVSLRRLHRLLPASGQRKRYFGPVSASKSENCQLSRLRFDDHWESLLSSATPRLPFYYDRERLVVTFSKGPSCVSARSWWCRGPRLSFAPVSPDWRRRTPAARSGGFFRASPTALLCPSLHG